MSKGKINLRASLAAVGIGFWLTMAGGVSAGPGGGERIVGGNVADPADWPYVAAITDPSGDQFCGGTVISPDAVLTAAHCALGNFGNPANPNSMRVVTGRPDLSDEGSGQELLVEEVFVHHQYLRKGRHDVAVLRLADSSTPIRWHPSSRAPQRHEQSREDRIAAPTSPFRARSSTGSTWCYAAAIGLAPRAGSNRGRPSLLRSEEALLPRSVNASLMIDPLDLPFRCNNRLAVRSSVQSTRARKPPITGQEEGTNGHVPL